ncbi:hypothetical protein [Angelakisella massiliensis]|uniref:hypothetical protein n=1 Tax=Angelakisella massiliensis TaxID=1871018 RepID=UPI0024B14EA8|nr:hypothetical protein [Angelakisella massiliensis]
MMIEFFNFKMIPCMVYLCLNPSKEHQHSFSYTVQIAILVGNRIGNYIAVYPNFFPQAVNLFDPDNTVSLFAKKSILLPVPLHSFRKSVPITVYFQGYGRQILLVGADFDINFIPPCLNLTSAAVSFLMKILVHIIEYGAGGIGNAKLFSAKRTSPEQQSAVGNPILPYVPRIERTLPIHFFGVVGSNISGCQGAIFAVAPLFCQVGEILLQIIVGGNPFIAAVRTHILHFLRRITALPFHRTRLFLDGALPDVSLLAFPAGDIFGFWSIVLQGFSPVKFRIPVENHFRIH